jgi:hypothetical protein
MFLPTKVILKGGDEKSVSDPIFRTRRGGRVFQDHLAVGLCCGTDLV